MKKITTKVNKISVPLIVKLFEDNPSYDSTIDSNLIDKLLKDIDISSALNKIERAVAGRVLTIETSIPELEDQAKEIEKRFSSIKFNRILNHLITARYYGYSGFEIVYKEDFTIQTLIPIPHNYLRYERNEKAWKLRVGSTDIPLNREKFLLSIHRWNPASPEGKTIFEPCRDTFLSKDRFTRQLKRISDKYGDVITLYPFDSNLSEKEAKELGEKVANLYGGDMVGVPVFNDDYDLGKTLQFIKLSDLDPEIYVRLEAKEKEKLIQNLLGATLTMESGSMEGKGTNALGKVHQDGFEQVVEEVCNFVTDSLYQLIETDSIFFGYNPQDFEWKLKELITEAEKREIERQQEANQGLKLDNLVKLSNAGYELDNKYLGEYLGINYKHLVKKASKLSNPFPFGINKEGGEFSENNSDDPKLFQTTEMIALYETYMQKKLEEFTASISAQIEEQIKKVKEGMEFNFDLDYSVLEDDLILSQLKGYINSKGATFKEVIEEFNPFTMKYEEAIKSFMDKTPILYETIEEITDEIRSNFVWLKKCTDLEITTKLFDSMKKNLENGGTFKEWMEDCQQVIEKAGLGNQGYYLENVYRTNMATQYSIGNYKQMMDVVEDFPYWEYRTIADNRRSIICTKLDGQIHRYDSPFWKIYYPPNHFRCRSTVLARSGQELKEMGLKISKKDIKLDLDLGTFAGNPAETYWENIKKAAEEKGGNKKLWE